MFQDREVFVRTGGQVKFVKISAKLQKLIAALVVGVLVVLLSVTTTAIVRDMLGAADRAELAKEQSEVAVAQKRVADYRDKVGAVAADVDARQDYLETLMGEYTGQEITPDKTEKIVKDDSTAALDIKQVLGKLLAARDRQDRYAQRLTLAVEKRSARAEAAIRDFGIDPKRLSKTAPARGGPFEPYRAHGKTVDDLGPAIATLDKALLRMERLEQALVAMPSVRPANVEMVTSSYGYRRDPFTGAGAFHSGLDFRGSLGTPIKAAASGRVSFVGRKSGYGNVVEIDHGQGIVTRYAHLSRFDVKTGQTVPANATIARMGSTGRSTGTHLHFEVRMNGQAMNPRKFLEANDDVLKIKAVAERRITDRQGA